MKDRIATKEIPVINVKVDSYGIKPESFSVLLGRNPRNLYEIRVTRFLGLKTIANKNGYTNHFELETDLGQVSLIRTDNTGFWHLESINLKK